MATRTQISRPAARKTAVQQPRRRTATGGTKPSKTRSSAHGGGSQLSSRKAEPTVQVIEQTTRRRFAEPPKVPGELPTPVATFYF